jgi:hypothetical protein
MRNRTGGGIGHADDLLSITSRDGCIVLALCSASLELRFTPEAHTELGPATDTRYFEHLVSDQIKHIPLAAVTKVQYEGDRLCVFTQEGNQLVGMIATGTREWVLEAPGLFRAEEAGLFARRVGEVKGLYEDYVGKARLRIASTGPREAGRIHFTIHVPEEEPGGVEADLGGALGDLIAAGHLALRAPVPDVSQFRSADPTVLVAVVGASSGVLGVFIGGLLKIAQQRGSRIIRMRSQGGAELEIPADMPRETIDELIDRIRRMDSADVFLA